MVLESVGKKDPWSTTLLSRSLSALVRLKLILRDFRYPGARVDSEAPFYQMNIPEVWQTFTFRERFPGHEELREYFAHIDKILNLSRDTYFNARVNHITHSKSENVWVVETQQGHIAKGKYLILATGVLHQMHKPDFPGLDKYKGELYHSAAWPKDFSAKGKKIGLIGAGATSVQITQELGKEADELTIFLRRPSYNLPMQQRPLDNIDQSHLKMFYPTLFQASRASHTGFPTTQIPQNTLSVPEHDRTAHFDRCWKSGGFHFLLNSYQDLFFTSEANAEYYKFWRRQVCQRLTDPNKQSLMAPEEMPYHFGTKRCPLEQDYYEILNQSNVHLHDLQSFPLREFSEKGIITADGTEHVFDTIIFATGFDSFTGSLLNLNLHRPSDNKSLREIWTQKEKQQQKEKLSIKTYLGLLIPHFPNLFLIYSPHAPIALSNGPTIIESQVEMIVEEVILRMEKTGAKSIVPREAAAEMWKREAIEKAYEGTLFPLTDSWWNKGGNGDRQKKSIKEEGKGGKKVEEEKKEMIDFIGGIHVYESVCREILREWKGFKVVYDDPKQKWRRRWVELKHVVEHVMEHLVGGSKDAQSSGPAADLRNH